MCGMHQPWRSEDEIDAARATVLIADRFPELAGEPVARLSSGWDNVVFRVGDSWLFRIPRREIGAELLTWEIRFLNAIAGSFELPIPVPHFVATPGPDFPWPFAGYPFLEGETACRLDLDDEARVRLAAPLGAFLRRLHELDPHRPGIRGDTIGRVAFRRRLAFTTKRLAYLESVGFLESAARYLPLLDAPPSDRRPCLVHGDLYARHLLVENGALAGIIDWGDAHFGDPACDLTIVWTFLPEEARPAFREAYGPISAITQARAVARAIHHGAGLAQFAHDTEERHLLAESRRLFRQIAAL